jgi:hypothetical protein
LKFRLRFCVSTKHKLQLTAILYSYWRSVLEIDPDSIWLDLCLNSDLATSRCRAFLRGYVEDSVQEIPTLGPEETVKKRTITSANSLLQVWRGLIARADATVLKHKRREDPSKKDTWTLKFMDHSNRQGRGPVFEISRVSQTPALSPLLLPPPLYPLFASF